MGIVVGHDANPGLVGLAALGGAQAVTNRANLMWAYEQQQRQQEQAAQNSLQQQQLNQSGYLHMADMANQNQQNALQLGAHLYSQQLGIDNDKADREQQNANREDVQQFQAGQQQQQQAFAADQAQRQQEAALVKAGKMRFTPKQKQEMTDTQDAIAKLASDPTMSADDKQKGMQMLQAKLRAIRPLPVPDDEVPQTPQQQAQSRLVKVTDPVTGLPVAAVIDRNGVPKRFDAMSPEDAAAHVEYPKGQGIGQTWELGGNGSGNWVTRDHLGNVKPFSFKADKPEKVKPLTRREQTGPDIGERQKLFEQAEKNLRQASADNTIAPPMEKIHAEAERLLQIDDEWHKNHGGALPTAKPEDMLPAVKDVHEALKGTPSARLAAVPLGIVNTALKKYKNEGEMLQDERDELGHAAMFLHDAMFSGQRGAPRQLQGLWDELKKFQGQPQQPQQNGGAGGPQPPVNPPAPPVAQPQALPPQAQPAAAPMAQQPMQNGGAGGPRPAAQPPQGNTEPMPLGSKLLDVNGRRFGTGELESHLAEMKKQGEDVTVRFINPAGMLEERKVPAKSLDTEGRPLAPTADAPSPEDVAAVHAGLDQTEPYGKQLPWLASHVSDVRDAIKQHGYDESKYPAPVRAKVQAAADKIELFRTTLDRPLSKPAKQSEMVDGAVYAMNNPTTGQPARYVWHDGKFTLITQG